MIIFVVVVVSVFSLPHTHTETFSCSKHPPTSFLIDTLRNNRKLLLRLGGLYLSWHGNHFRQFCCYAQSSSVLSTKRDDDDDAPFRANGFALCIPKKDITSIG
mmetsp:Transcript_13538/g.22535  ORF Transcript_13538/g.22535 Transcript_13538/m.22535 type:complete len:103 (-) Transcript_13538:477-785(-)